jgi:hypothetical protein
MSPNACASAWLGTRRCPIALAGRQPHASRVCRLGSERADPTSRAWIRRRGRSTFDTGTPVHGRARDTCDGTKGTIASGAGRRTVSACKQRARARSCTQIEWPSNKASGRSISARRGPTPARSDAFHLKITAAIELREIKLPLPQALDCRCRGALPSASETAHLAPCSFAEIIWVKSSAFFCRCGPLSMLRIDCA